MRTAARSLERKAHADAHDAVRVAAQHAALHRQLTPMPRGLFLEGKTLRISGPRITQLGRRPHPNLALTACKSAAREDKQIGIQNAS